MVKTITMRFNDDIFQNLYAKKMRFAQKRKESISWEELLIHLIKKIK